MIEWGNDPEKRKKAIAFVEATQQLIDSEGLENISIRKIAEKAGFHNSTIYLYFKDADQLILLASLRHFNEYSHKLAERSSTPSNPQENFLAIWQVFGESVFQKPQIFRNFFFGKYSDQLTPIIILYYRLFPEERGIYTEEIEAMYYGGNINDRCLKILKPLTQVDSLLVNEENLHLVNTIIVACLKALLDYACSSPEVSGEELNNRLMQMIRHVTGVK